MGLPEIKPPERIHYFSWSFLIFFIFIPGLLAIPLEVILSHGCCEGQTVEGGLFYGLVWLFRPVLIVYTLFGWIVRFGKYSVSAEYYKEKDKEYYKEKEKEKEK